MANRGNIARLAVSVALLALAGCASMNRQQCQVADWRLIGYQDGAAGKPAGVIGEYRKDCAEHAVVPDLDAWLAGRDEGLKEYCQPANGYRLGQTGHAYNAVCPPASEGAFHTAWVDGRTYYHARSALRSTDAQIQKRELEIGSLQHDRQDKLAELVRDGLRSEERILILYDIHAIEQDIDALEHEIDELEHELSHQQAYLDTLAR